MKDWVTQCLTLSEEKVKMGRFCQTERKLRYHFLCYDSQPLDSTRNTWWASESPDCKGPCLEFLIQYSCGGTQEFAFLKISQVLLMLLGQELYSENHCFIQCLIQNKVKLCTVRNLVDLSP